MNDAHGNTTRPTAATVARDLWSLSDVEAINALMLRLGGRAKVFEHSVRYTVLVDIDDIRAAERGRGGSKPAGRRRRSRGGDDDPHGIETKE